MYKNKVNMVLMAACFVQLLQVAHAAGEHQNNSLQDLPVLLKPDEVRKIIDALPDNINIATEDPGITVEDLVDAKWYLSNKSVNRIRQIDQITEKNKRNYARFAGNSTTHYITNALLGTFFGLAGIIGAVTKLEGSVEKSIALSLSVGTAVVGLTKLVSTYIPEKSSPGGSKLLSAMNFGFSGLFIACARTAKEMGDHTVAVGCLAGSTVFAGLGINELFNMSIKNRELALRKQIIADEEDSMRVVFLEETLQDKKMREACNCLAEVFNK